jgi:mannosyltransferase OCH1-like enzyme
MIIILGVIVIIMCLWCYRQKKQKFPKIIFQTWKTKRPHGKMAYWAETWKKHNLEYMYIIWDDADNRLFVEKNFKWFLPTYDEYDVEIKRADAIRYMFLYTYGGIYADLDFECLKPFDTLLEKYNGYDIILGEMDSGNFASQWHLSNNIPNAIMISKPRCSFWIKVLEKMIVKAKVKGGAEEQTGPIVLKEVYSDSWGYSIKLLPNHILYPISWVTDEYERKQALNTEVYSLTNHIMEKYPLSYAATYWAHSW